MTTQSKQLSLIPKPKKGKRPIPAEWKPPERAYALAEQCGQSVPFVEGIFRDYCAANGVLYADHDAAFCNFIRNQSRYDNRSRANGGLQQTQASGRGSIITAFDRDIAERERAISARRAAVEDQEMRAGTLPLLPAR